jgi:hypothetical protein
VKPFLIFAPAGIPAEAHADLKAIFARHPGPARVRVVAHGQTLEFGEDFKVDPFAEKLVAELNSWPGFLCGTQERESM